MKKNVSSPWAYMCKTESETESETERADREMHLDRQIDGDRTPGPMFVLGDSRLELLKDYVLDPDSPFSLSVVISEFSCLCVLGISVVLAYYTRVRWATGGEW